MTAPHSILPVLKVNDLNETIEFYRRLFGFHVCSLHPEGSQPDTCIMAWGAIELLFSTGAHLGGPPQLTGTLYFNLQGVAELFERVKDQVEVVWPLEEMDYGTREFGIRDCNGYTLAFAEPLDPSPA
jgi:uncharacterized glyoxalase superfamily protein PhnB